jgi:hypothetical protein
MEVAWQSAIVRWTLLQQPGGLAVCRRIRESVLKVAEDEKADSTLLCMAHTRGQGPPPLVHISARWCAAQRLQQLERLGLGVRVGLVTIEVASGVDDLWALPTRFQITGTTFLRAVAVKDSSSAFAYTTQKTVNQTIFPGTACSQQLCIHRNNMQELWVSWLRQFKHRLSLPLQEKAPFEFPTTQSENDKMLCWTGRVLCDLRMPAVDGCWVYLRASSQEILSG